MRGRVLTLSGWLDTEGDGQTLQAVGILEGKIERQIVDRETRRWDGETRNFIFF